MRKYMFKMFMQKAGDPNPSGGGGGDDPADAEAKLIATINKVVHAAMSDRDKRLETKLVNTMNAAIGGKFDEIRQLLVESDEPKDPPADPIPGQPTKAARLSPEDTAMLKKSQQDAAEAKKLAQEWQSKAEKERQANQRAEERQLLVSALQGKVKPAVLDMVVDQLHSKHVTRDEETGSILWKDADGTLVPAKDGVGSWAKSEVGKEFAPPREARGSGGRGGEEIPSKPGSMTLDGLGEIVNQAMARGR